MMKGYQGTTSGMRHRTVLAADRDMTIGFFDLDAARAPKDVASQLGRVPRCGEQ